MWGSVWFAFSLFVLMLWTEPTLSCVLNKHPPHKLYPSPSFQFVVVVCCCFERGSKFPKMTWNVWVTRGVGILGLCFQSVDQQNAFAFRPLCSYSAFWVSEKPTSFLEHFYPLFCELQLKRKTGSVWSAKGCNAQRNRKTSLWYLIHCQGLELPGTQASGHICWLLFGD